MKVPQRISGILLANSVLLVLYFITVTPAELFYSTITLGPLFVLPCVFILETVAGSVKSSTGSPNSEIIHKSTSKLGTFFKILNTAIFFLLAAGFIYVFSLFFYFLLGNEWPARPPFILGERPEFLGFEITEEQNANIGLFLHVMPVTIPFILVIIIQTILEYFNESRGRLLKSLNYLHVYVLLLGIVVLAPAIFFKSVNPLNNLLTSDQFVIVFIAAKTAIDVYVNARIDSEESVSARKYKPAGSSDFYSK